MLHSWYNEKKLYSKHIVWLLLRILFYHIFYLQKCLNQGSKWKILAIVNNLWRNIFVKNVLIYIRMIDGSTLKHWKKFISNNLWGASPSDVVHEDQHCQYASYSYTLRKYIFSTCCIEFSNKCITVKPMIISLGL